MNDPARTIDPDRLRRALLRVLAPGLVVRVIEESTVTRDMTVEPMRLSEDDIARAEARLRRAGIR